jgi:redox-sensitive bicupin YhaK (pirin superfamily)
MTTKNNMNNSMVRKTIHRANSRGYADHSWLKTYHTFSFANYYDPSRVRFGLLRVLNDDIIEPGMGFGTHPHDNMEIVTIPLSGALEHKDSTGGGGIIYTGDVQVMSAGSGLTHSEFNPSDTEPVNLLQIWIFPKERDIKPRYDQRTFDPKDRINKINTVVSPLKNNGSLYLNQDAYFSLVKLDKNKEVEYEMNTTGNGLYIFVIDGHIKTSDEELNKRDGIGLENLETTYIKAIENSEILFIEVPMK